MADGPSSQATASDSSGTSLSDVACRLPLVPAPDGEEEPDELPEGSIECSICLQACVHPVRLPCSHIFCFLCVKGIANHSKRCALCRSEIPHDFLIRPILLNTDDVLHTQAFDGKYQWFYEGIRGWWQYDVRASTEIEDRFQKGERVFEMLIAGFLYVVDMENMIQYRRNTPSRRRRIKRDLVNIPDKKGVAGLSCRIRPPKRTGGDGGEREDGVVPAPGVAASAGGGGIGMASAAGVPTDAAHVNSLQQQVQNLTLADAGGGADRNPRGSRNARGLGSRLAAVNGGERAAAGIRANPRTSDAIAVHQPNPGFRCSRVTRQAVDGLANGQQNQDASVNRVAAPGVDMAANRQPNQETRVNRSELEGVDGEANSRPSSLSAAGNQINSQSVDASANSQANQDGRVNRVNSDRHDSSVNGQQLSLSSRDNQVNSHDGDMLANRQANQGIRGNNQSNSQRVQITTTDQSSVGIGNNQVDNRAVASQVNQVNTVQNHVTSAPNESAMLGQVGAVDDVARVRGASAASRMIDGVAPMDRTVHVDGSSDSDF